MANSEEKGRREFSPDPSDAKIKKLQEQMDFVINFVGDLAEQVTELKAEVTELKRNINGLRGNGNNE